MTYKIELPDDDEPCAAPVFIAAPAEPAEPAEPAPEPAEPLPAPGYFSRRLPPQLRPPRPGDAGKWLAHLIEVHPQFKNAMRYSSERTPYWIVDIHSDDTHRFVDPDARTWWALASFHRFALVPPLGRPLWIEYRTAEPDYFTLYQATKAHPLALAFDASTPATLPIVDVDLRPPVILWLRSAFRSVLDRWPLELQERAMHYR